MAEAVRLISARRLEALEISLRRLRWAAAAMGFLAVILLAVAAGLPKGLRLAPAVGPAEASSNEGPREGVPAPPALLDPLYDEFLQQYAALRGDPDRRRYLTSQVVAAAATHRLDPDLLFGLIATESSFDSKAVSSKGARGLGQMIFTTAQAVAPRAVRQPEDLHDVPRNLYATALHLRQLLAEREGDLRAALRAYYAGAADRHWTRQDREQYVARVSTHYAYLKAKRSYGHLSAARGGAPASSD